MEFELEGEGCGSFVGVVVGLFGLFFVWVGVLVCGLEGGRGEGRE